MKNRLKVLRAERDWTQAPLADALDVSRQTINAIETGKFDPSLPLAFRAARLFGMHIEEQEIFAPSLREELDRGIAQLDFSMGLDSTPRVMKMLTLVSIAVVMISWEAQRASGNPTPWWSVLGALWVFLPGCLGFAARKKTMERRLARRRALESMRAALDEDTIVLPQK